jgi:ABC-type uncharacterized transport system substrate-binding protein
MTIPLVIGFAANPVGTGLVVSLAPPGGNITWARDSISATTARVRHCSAHEW